MAGVQGAPGALEASRQLLGEQDLRELRLIVRAKPAILAFALEVVESDRATEVGAGRDVHDAGGRRLLQEVEEEVRQQKSGEIVHLELPLQPVRRNLAMRGVDPGVVDQHVETRMPPMKFLREGPRRRFAREVDDLEGDARVSRV